MRKAISLTINGLLAILLVATITGLTYSKTHPGWDGDVEYGVLGPGTAHRSPLNILIAYDEEIAGANYDWFGDSVSGRTYIEYQTRRAIYRFPSKFHLQIGAYVQWNSRDDATLEESLYEVEQELGWDKDLIYNGKWMRLLVAWTGQESVFGGKAHMGHAACISTIQADWTDDNTAQEEVGHLFGLDFHCKSGGCVMSVLQKFYGYINENLRPIEDRTVEWIPVFNTQSVGCVSHSWCSPHYAQLIASNGNPDVSGNGMVSHPKINPVNPSPEGKTKINPTHPEVPYLIVLGVVLATIVTIYLYRRRKRT